MRYLYQSQPVRDVDNSVRPSLRVIGALMLVGVALMYVFKATALISSKVVILTSCVQEVRSRDRPWCELGSFMLGLLPPESRGLMLGIAVAGFSAILFLIAWKLVQPLIVSVKRESNLHADQDRV